MLISFVRHTLKIATRAQSVSAMASPARLRTHWGNLALARSKLHRHWRLTGCVDCGRLYDRVPNTRHIPRLHDFGHFLPETKSAWRLHIRLRECEADPAATLPFHLDLEAFPRSFGWTRMLCTSDLKSATADYPRSLPSAPASRRCLADSSGRSGCGNAQATRRQQRVARDRAGNRTSQSDGL